LDNIPTNTVGLIRKTKTTQMKLRLFITVMCFVGLTLSAQNIQRSTLGSSGDATEITIGDKSYYVSHSVGQNSVIGTFSKDNYTIRQGFQQPPIKVEIIRGLDNHLNVVVYPNPVKTIVTILFNEVLKASINVVVYDISGKVVIDKSQNPTRSFNLDMSSFASGVYLLKLTSENKKFNARLIKE
jgi:Secretion system C-terminal sorting domain